MSNACFVNFINGVKYVHKPNLEHSYYDREKGVVYLTTRRFKQMKKEIEKWNKRE